jgi:hypothetical protein
LRGKSFLSAAAARANNGLAFMAASHPWPTPESTICRASGDNGVAGAPPQATNSNAKQ